MMHNIVNLDDLVHSPEEFDQIFDTFDCILLYSISIVMLVV